MTNPSLAFPVAIYRCTTTGDTESTIAPDEGIGFDYGITDQSLRAVQIYNWEITNRRTDVPTPQNRGISKPDTGIATIVLKIGIKFNEGVSEDPNIGILTSFGLGDQTVRGIFSKGRFGVRNDKKVWMNFQPTNTAGWKITDANFDDLLEWGNLFDCLVTMEFAGATSELVAQIETEGG